MSYHVASWFSHISSAVQPGVFNTVLTSKMVYQPRELQYGRSITCLTPSSGALSTNDSSIAAVPAAIDYYANLQLYTAGIPL